MFDYSNLQFLQSESVSNMKLGLTRSKVLLLCHFNAILLLRYHLLMKILESPVEEGFGYSDSMLEE